MQEGLIIYMEDGLGSVTEVTNWHGTVRRAYVYDSFGNIETQTGTLNPTNPFKYTGREIEEETGLYYYRARYYDPEIGRFLNEDPIEFDGGINFYAYVGNNPVNYVDPFGLARQCICEAFGAGLTTWYVVVLREICLDDCGKITKKFFCVLTIQSNSNHLARILNREFCREFPGIAATRECGFEYFKDSYFGSRFDL